MKIPLIILAIGGIMIGVGSITVALNSELIDERFSSTTILYLGEELEKDQSIFTPIALENGQEVVFGIQSSPPEAILKISILDPDEELIEEGIFNDVLTVPIFANKSGTYQFLVFNLVSDTVTVGALLTQDSLQGIHEDTFAIFNYLFMGFITIGIGILVIFSGIISFALLKRNTKKSQKKSF